MPKQQHFSRINVADVKMQIFKRIGSVKAEKYFYSLKRMLNYKMSKSDFRRICNATIGKENIALHNLFIQSVLRNACLAQTPPARETTEGNSQNSKISNGSFGDTFPPASAFKGTMLSNWDKNLKDRPSPLGPYGNMPPGSIPEISGSCDIKKLREKQGAVELISVGSKAMLEVGSVEDGEEVEQVRGSPCVQSRSPLRAPLGIPMAVGSSHRTPYSSLLSAFCLPKRDTPDLCHSCCELPDTMTLRMSLEHKVEMEGLGLPVDSVNLLNDSLNVFLKRLIKPCVDLAKARRNSKMANGLNGDIVHGVNGARQKESVEAFDKSYCASLLDFRTAMESSPQLLGQYWPIHLEKILLRATRDH